MLEIEKISLRQQQHGKASREDVSGWTVIKVSMLLLVQHLMGVRADITGQGTIKCCTFISQLGRAERVLQKNIDVLDPHGLKTKLQGFEYPGLR